MCLITTCSFLSPKTHLLLLVHDIPSEFVQRIHGQPLPPSSYSWTTAGWSQIERCSDEWQPARDENVLSSKCGTRWHGEVQGILSNTVSFVTLRHFLEVLWHMTYSHVSRLLLYLLYLSYAIANFFARHETGRGSKIRGNGDHFFCHPDASPKPPKPPDSNGNREM